MTTPILPESLSLEQMNTVLSVIALVVTAIAAGLILVVLWIALAKLAHLARLLLGGGWPE
jgi:hypothetical protein